MTPGARTLRLAILAVAAMTALAGCGSSTTANTQLAGNPEAGIHKIRHVIVIVQENRSFDSYFGTYPGADGIPMKNGVPTVCSYDYEIRQCVSPYYDPSVINTGGPHNVVNSRRDVAHGRMDGFVRQALDARTKSCGQHVLDPSCTIDVSRPDVMGYHDYHQIPNYWAYARNFVLDDHFFASNDGWSEPMHEAIVSAWSAKCTSPFDPMSCVSSADRTGAPHTPGQPWYPWTDLTWLLHRYDVSWAYYISAGMQPDCATGVMGCHLIPQNAATPSIWNPLPHFTDVQQDHQVNHVQDSSYFFKAAKAGRLPAVSWVIPNYAESEHPPASITAGQDWVTRVINAVMRSKDWKSSAIFLTWDDWGGFYDHVVPPQR